MRYRLGAAKGFERIPEDVSIDSEFGRCVIDYTRKKDGQLVVDIDYRITTQRIPVEKYQSFRSFVSKMDSALNETLGVVEKK
jgi:hypothetical protein